MSTEPPEPPDTPNSSFEKPSAPDAVPGDLYTYRQRRSNHLTEKQPSDGHEGEKSLDDISGEEMNFSLHAPSGATKRSMVHKETGQSKYGYVGYSWTTLFWGPFPALFRGDFLTFVAFIGIGILVSVPTAGIGGFVGMILWSFVYNDYYTKKLIREGYEFQEPGSKRDHPENSAEETTPTPEDTRDSSFETPKVPAASPEDLYADLQLSASDQAEPQPSAERGIEAASPERVYSGGGLGGCLLVLIILFILIPLALYANAEYIFACVMTLGFSCLS